MNFIPPPPPRYAAEDKILRFKQTSSYLNKATPAYGQHGQPYRTCYPKLGIALWAYMWFIIDLLNLILMPV